MLIYEHFWRHTMFLQAFLRIFLPMTPPQTPGLNKVFIEVNRLVHTCSNGKNGIHFLPLCKTYSGQYLLSRPSCHCLSKTLQPLRHLIRYSPRSPLCRRIIGSQLNWWNLVYRTMLKREHITILEVHRNPINNFNSMARHTNYL